MKQVEPRVAHFTERDPLRPAFWDQRFAENFMPWDHGGVPAELVDFAAAATGSRVIFIPGCGLGHEVRHLATAGWDVSAIDFSPVAVAAAQRALGHHRTHVSQGDFFAWVPKRRLDVIYERAFLCALPRAQWPAVVARWADLLPQDGLLAGFFFYDNAPKGPPFGADRAQLEALLQPHFILQEDAAARQSIAVFSGRERWQVWRRRTDSRDF